MRELNNQWSEGWRRIVLKISVFVWFVKNNSSTRYAGQFMDDGLFTKNTRYGVFKISTALTNCQS